MPVGHVESPSLESEGTNVVFHSPIGAWIFQPRASALLAVHRFAGVPPWLAVLSWIGGESFMVWWV